MYQRTDQCFSLTHLLGAVKRDYGSVRYVQAEQGRTANERTSSATDAQTDQAMQEPVQLPVDARAWLPRDSPSARARCASRAGCSRGYGRRLPLELCGHGAASALRVLHLVLRGQLFSGRQRARGRVLPRAKQHTLLHLIPTRWVATGTVARGRHPVALLPGLVLWRLVTRCFVLLVSVLVVWSLLPTWVGVLQARRAGRG